MDTVNTFKENNLNNDWWKSTTVYQIYPRSFYDSNDDGIGDLKGIIQKLDYLQDIGFETIWISPFTQSPQRDFGYDVSDYCAIAPEYGTMEDFDTLLKEVHQRKMKLVFDLVMNHTSDQHAWFKESASSKDNPKADWYVWKEGKGKDGRKRPNNWKSMSGNPAWTYHPTRKQFYYNAFLPFQPDLNYENPDVKKAMFDVARFWLKKGIDGFRLDIISAIYEDPLYRNNPFSFHVIPSDKSLTIFFQHLKNNFLQEKSFSFSTELREVTDEFSPKRILIGESHGAENLIHRFCLDNGKNGLDMVFLFNAISMPFKAKKYKDMVEKFEKYFAAPLMPNLVFSNHDRTRTITRLGGSVAKRKLQTLFQFTARGVPFTYYGEEIGIPRVKIPLKEAKDAVAIQQQWIPQFLVDLHNESLNRDECRTPMLWNNSDNAGFCTSNVKPWLPIAPNYKLINVQTQNNDNDSLLNFYKKILNIRKETPALHKGNFEIANDLCTDKIVAYYRIFEKEKFLILLNMSDENINGISENGTVLLSTHHNTQHLKLQPFEGKLIKQNDNN
jgi:oligo-1,6-glucosidase/alpha-glucosidase